MVRPTFGGGVDGRGTDMLTPSRQLTGMDEARPDALPPRSPWLIMLLGWLVLTLSHPLELDSEDDFVKFVREPERVERSGFEECVDGDDLIWGFAPAPRGIGWLPMERRGGDLFSRRLWNFSRRNFWWRRRSPMVGAAPGRFGEAMARGSDPRIHFVCCASGPRTLR